MWYSQWPAMAETLLLLLDALCMEMDSGLQPLARAAFGCLRWQIVAYPKSKPLSSKIHLHALFSRSAWGNYRLTAQHSEQRERDCPVEVPWLLLLWMALAVCCS